jgi:phage terminase large subunit-like protein
MEFPSLRHDQATIAANPAKTKVLAMGRRWGKTILGGWVTMNVLRLGGRAAWVVPEYKNGRALWRYAASACASLAQAGIYQISKTDRVITSNNGGFFAMYSADNIDAIRSEAFNLVVGDEAARIDGDGWNDAVRPTLADADGDEILISTPKGLNWFYKEWLMGQNKQSGYASWTAPTKANPNPMIRNAYEMARVRLPERTFSQEWDAMFIEGGTIFRRVRDASTLQPLEKDADGGQYVIGVDWGRSNDATVFCVMDVKSKCQVFMDRMTDTDYATQRLRLAALSEKFNKALIIAESNSMGQPNIEALQGMGLYVTPFTTTNATKANIIQALELAFERGEITLLDNELQIMELMSYQSEKLPSGLVRYSSPDGLHDDTVMALALAWSTISDNNNWLIS